MSTQNVDPIEQSSPNPIPTPSPKPLPPPAAPKTLSPDQCCKEGGVSQMCMGLCMDPMGPASRNLPKSWVNACEQHKNTIEKCFAPGKILKTKLYSYVLDSITALL